jgi:protein O-mannosyl-transferase
MAGTLTKRVRPNPKREPSATKWLWILCAFLVLAIGAAYQPVWHASFIWDDDQHLTRNPCIVGSLGFKGIWTTAAATYYPLVLSNFWIQHAFWGLNPLPYHLVNLAMHAACGILLWQVLRHLHVKGAWLGTALWALHPVQVESVAWITELKNTQSCFFYLLSILFFLRWHEITSGQDRQRTAWNYVAALLCAVLAILSKSSTVMLPVVLGLCWWWQDRRWRWRNVTTLSPFLFVSIFAGAWTIWEQKFHSNALGATWTQTWLERFIIAGRDIWFYLGKLLWPHPLSFIYPRWQIDASQLLAYLPLLAAAAGLIALWWNRNDWPRSIFFAAAYFVISLFPVLDFFDVYFFRYSFVGDHLQYLASIGPLVLIGSGIASGFDFFPRKSQRLSEIAVCSVLLLVLGTLTCRQAGVYRNVDTLWSDTVEKNPTSWMAQNSFALVLMRSGRVREALPHLERALEVDRDNVETQNNLGYASALLGRIEESLPYFRRALEIEPDRAAVHHNLGKALTLLGRFEEADAHLRRALEIDPNYVPAYSDLGNLLLQLGRANESLANLQQALKLDPDYLAAHYNIAKTLLQLGRADEAVSHLQKALVIEPSNPEGQRNLAWVLATSPEAHIRDGAKAVQLAERANELTKGGNPLIVVTLAAAYAEAGRFPNATQTAEKALQLATDRGLVSLAQAIRAHIELYRVGQPLRQMY